MAAVNSAEAKESEMEKEASAEAKESQMEKEAREWLAERARELAERESKFEADRARLEKRYGPLRTDFEVIMMRAKERFDKAKEAIDAGVGDEEEEEEEEGKGLEEPGSVWDLIFKKQKRRKKGDAYFWR